MAPGVGSGPTATTLAVGGSMTEGNSYGHFKTERGFFFAKCGILRVPKHDETPKDQRKWDRQTKPFVFSIILS